MADNMDVDPPATKTAKDDKKRFEVKKVINNLPILVSYLDSL